ncbi:MAG: IclR family transcriptional regulator [Pseudomonadota bacterium]
MAGAATIQALDRAIKLLRTVAQHNGLTLTQLCDLEAMPASSAHRMLATLEANRLIHQDPETGAWRIGVGAFEIGNAFLRNRKVAEVARPHLRALLAKCEETVSLAVLDEQTVTFIAQAESHNLIRTFHRPGSRCDVHVSASGKAILADLTPAERRALMAGYAFEPATARSIMTAAEFDRALATIKARGWAMDDEEKLTGLRCLAAAVHNEHGEPIAAVSISAPTIRMGDDQVPELVAALCRTADDITSAIGGRAPLGARQPDIEEAA